MQVILSKREYEELDNYKYELIRFKDDIQSCFSFERKVEFDEKLRINYSTIDIKSVVIKITKLADLVGLNGDEMKFLEEHLVK